MFLGCVITKKDNYFIVVFADHFGVHVPRGTLLFRTDPGENWTHLLRKNCNTSRLPLVTSANYFICLLCLRIASTRVLLARTTKNTYIKI